MNLNKPYLASLILLAHSVPVALYADFTAYSSLLIDFSLSSELTTSTDDPNGTWNNVTAPDDYRFVPVGTSADPISSAANLVRYSDGVTTGVSLSMIASSTGQSGMLSTTISADPNASFNATGLIPTSAQTDLLFGAKVYDGDSPTDISFVFNDLDDSLTYNLEFQAWSGATDHNPKTVIAQLGETSESSLLIDSNDSPSVYSFNGLSTNGSGQLSLTLTDLQKGPHTFNLNAMALTAIPEPSHFALGTGMLGILTVCSRCRRRT